MKFLAALLVFIVCLASLVSSTPVRTKRQWGMMPPPNDFGPSPYYGYGGGYYGDNYYGYGPYRPYWRRRRPTVIEKTVIYRNG
ncbi:hypothetical protein Y032_0028g1740 [Ancylostoma ceylanicum]|uniref:Uncharacterized protein n=1 Tax=Ancylostoma ceylanicum TaxID=53326 RepID=A0A016US17_9BILA|nr:hypothetical protein Y032_0028g1740 [Ancylostoma ceylanicum]